jgi:hypothetical protein
MLQRMADHAVFDRFDDFAIVFPMKEECPHC